MFLLFHHLIDAIKFSTLSILTMPASSPLSASFIAESVVSFGKVIVVIFLNISVGKDTHIYSNCKTIIPFFLFWSIISQENLLYSRKRRIFATMEYLVAFFFRVAISRMNDELLQKERNSRHTFLF